MALAKKSEVCVARVWEIKGKDLFSSQRQRLFSEKGVIFHVLGFRELMLSFVEEKLDERVGQLRVCPKVSHTRFLVK